MSIMIRPLQGEMLFLSELVAASTGEGFEFVRRLVDEYNDGRNRFDRSGERLLQVVEDGRIIGVGGLNRDPYLPEYNAGRVRHIYILPHFRRLGIGRRLMAVLMAHGQDHFDFLTLRTLTREAAAFYLALGFETCADVPGATHIWRISHQG